MTALALIVAGCVAVFIVVLKLALKAAERKGRSEAKRESLEEKTKRVAWAHRIRERLARRPDERERLRKDHTRK